MKSSNSNARSGKRAEEMFARNILYQPAWEVLLQMMGYTQAKATEPQLVDNQRRKGDVVVEFTTNHPTLRFNIKSFSDSSPGINQLERSKLSNYCERYHILSRDKEFIECLLERREVGSRLPFIQTADEEQRATAIFGSFEPGLSALCGSDHPQFLALYNWGIYRWHIYDMNSQVAPLVRCSEISFTKEMKNIQIGRYIIIQRHGSDGSGRPGSANDMQVKMLVEKFYSDVKPCAAFTCRPMDD